jgi:hypothetical protein
MLEVEWMTYDMWEKGAWVPGDDYAERLAEFTGSPIETVVWMLYLARLARKRENSGFRGRFAFPKVGPRTQSDPLAVA